MAIDLDNAKRLLENRQAELQELSDISSQSRQAVELDQQSVGRLSRMDAMQQQAMAQAQERTRSRDLVRIDQALSRIKDGDYGYCEDCGNEIPVGRLEIDPMAERCVGCA